MTLTKPSTSHTRFAVALEPGNPRSLLQTARVSEPTSSTWPDHSGPSSRVIANLRPPPGPEPSQSGPSKGSSAAASTTRAIPDTNSTELTIDESGVGWLPINDESDEESPLRLTLTRGELEDGWQPLGERVRLASGKRVPGTRYRIVRWLGEGGMGMVFEAIHVDIQRPVALKILKPRLAEGATGGASAARQQRERFLDEARAVAQVDSRFVVDVLDFGELPDGRPFYTMELLDPVGLNDLLREGPMAIERVLPILRQCCKALAAVHARGLVHRDVKPQNVLLQREDGRGDAVRIVDFGIAAAFGSRPRVAGTAMYMAPEQIRGQEFDARLDVYGLGCVAYELLTAVTPFEGASATEVVHRHLDDEPAPPSARLPGLPPELDAVLLRCLAKAPEDRYANMHELEAALCEVQIALGFTTPWDDLPLPAISDEARAELHRRMPRPKAPRRRLGPRLRLIAGAFAVGLISALALVSLDPRRGEGDRTEFNAAMRAVEAQVEAARVAGSRAYWAYPPADQPDYPTALRVIGALEAEDGPLRYLAQVRAQQLRDEFTRTLVRLGDQYWDAPNGRPFAAEYYAQALLFDRAEPRALERASLSSAQLADVAARADAGELSPVELEIGEVLRALAEPDADRRRSRIAALLADESHVASSFRTRSQLETLVGVEWPAPQTPAPPPAAREGSKQDSKPTPTYTRDEPSTAEQARNYTRRGERALEQGDRDAAEGLFAKALALDPKLVSAHAGLAEIHFARGRYQRAAAAARRGVGLRPDDPALQLLLGDSSLKSRRYEAARAAYERAKRLGHAKADQRLRQLDEVEG